MEARGPGSITLSRQVRPAAEVLASQLGEELIMLDLASERYFGLDSVGTTMWEELTTAPSIGAAVDALQEIYEVDQDTLVGDVSRLIAQLAEEMLVEISDATAA